MNDYAAHSRALASLQGRLGHACPVVTWDKEDVAVIPGSVEIRSDLTSGGFQQNSHLDFEALVSSFDGYTDPKELKDDLSNQLISYLGDDYKVDSVLIRPGGLQVKVQCTAITQNA